MSLFQRSLVMLFLLLAAPVSRAWAQEAATARADAGPRLETTVAGMTAAPADAAPMQVRRTNSMGRPIALMVVGGAAVILGAVIGSDVGTLISVGGAVAFLYGLYLYLR